MRVFEVVEKKNNLFIVYYYLLFLEMIGNQRLSLKTGTRSSRHSGTYQNLPNKDNILDVYFFPNTSPLSLKREFAFSTAL